jgi:hypothetical protein
MIIVRIIYANYKGILLAGVLLLIGFGLIIKAIFANNNSTVGCIVRFVSVIIVRYSFLTEGFKILNDIYNDYKKEKKAEAAEAREQKIRGVQKIARYLAAKKRKELGLD